MVGPPSVDFYKCIPTCTIGLYCLNAIPDSGCKIRTDWFFVKFMDQFSQTALTKAGLPAESHTAKRTQDFPEASSGIEKRLLPNAGKSVAEMT